MNHTFAKTGIDKNDVRDATWTMRRHRWQTLCRAYFNENPLEYILHPVSSRIRFFCLVMLLGNPFYYWIWAHVLVQPYENLTARLAVSIFGAVLLLPKINHHPTSLRTGFVFVGVVWLQLPVFFIWMYLCNGGAPVWMATVVGMILIWYHVTDWRIATAGLMLGVPLAWGLYSITDVPTSPVWSEQDVATHTMVIGFGLSLAVILGIFSANAKKIQMKLSKARALQVALQSLAGSIAHEMRNPLGQIKHAINMSAELLPATHSAHAVVLTQQQLCDLHRHLMQGQVAIRRGLQVIDMTLDEVNFRPMDDSQFVRLSAIQTVQKALDEYDFDSALDRSRVHVVLVQDFDFKGHETALMFVVFNLLRNALYYFRQYPHATITLTIESHKIHVKDTGPGMSEQTQTRLFEAFVTSDKVGGTGLGLAYCQRVMQAFGGYITCDSEQGVFTEFTLFFPPLAIDEEMQPQSGVTAQQVACVSGSGRGTPLKAAVLQGKTLLIADDMDMNRAMVSAYAQRWGMQVLEATDGLEVLRLLADDEVRVDALVLDMHMPGMGGIEATRTLRTVQRYKHVPVLALTGNSDSHSRKMALAAGMNDLLSKPFDGAVLQHKLCQLLGEKDDMSFAQVSTHDQTGGVKPGGVSIDLSLLDVDHVHALQSDIPECLSQLWSTYLENFSQLQRRMQAALESRNLQELVHATHGLVGNSGNVGALAVHSFLKHHVMPDIERGQWPRDERWLEILTDLRQRTDAQMSQYLLHQTAVCRRA